MSKEKASLSTKSQKNELKSKKLTGLSTNKENVKKSPND